MSKKRTTVGVETKPKAEVAPKVPKAESGVENKKAVSYIVWLKNRSYIDETKRVEAGLYLVNEVPARIAKLPADVVEVFENEVTSRKLATIARWAGLNPDGIEDEEILSKLLSTEFLPF